MVGHGSAKRQWQSSSSDQCPPLSLALPLALPSCSCLSVQAQQGDPTCADGSSALRFIDGRARLQADLSYERIGPLLGKVQAQVGRAGGAVRCGAVRCSASRPTALVCHSRPWPPLCLILPA